MENESPNKVQLVKDSPEVRQSLLARLRDLRQLKGQLLSEDDLHWILGIGRFGQSEEECEILPRLIREHYAQVQPVAADTKTSV
jgi:hypothetical protein